MYLRVSRQKRKDGSVRSHFQIAHNSWDPATRRSRVKILHNVGRADSDESVQALRRLARSILARCDPDQIAATHPDTRLLGAFPYGDLFALEALWQRLGIPRAIARARGSRRLRFDVERALFVLVANRACAPASKLHCFRQWLAEEVRLPGVQSLSLQHLYRAMDFLEAHRDTLEEEIFWHTANLLQLDTELLFFDTTSLHWEIDEEDAEEVTAGAGAGGRTYAPLRQRGFSKNGRGDAPQAVIGLAVTREGFPVRHWVFPGNTVDVETVQQARRDLAGWRLTRCVFVGDAGMVSAANLRALAAAGGRYLVGQSLRAGGEAYEAVLGTPGRYRKVAENLRVKEVTVGKGERRRRYALCFNPEEAKRQKGHRERVLAELEAELASLAETRRKAEERAEAKRAKERAAQGQGDREAGTEATGGADPNAEQGGGERRGHRKRECELQASGRYGRYLRTRADGSLAIDRTKVRAAGRRDGKFVVHGNDDSLSGEDMALGYKQLQRVEQAWRTLKSGLRLRPVYHWAPHRIHAHVTIAVLALLLERMAERACGQTWGRIRDRLKRIQLAQLLSGGKTVWQVTEPSEEARKILEKLELDEPSPILRID